MLELPPNPFLHIAFVTNWAFLSVNGLRLFFNSVIPFFSVLKRFSFFSVGKVSVGKQTSSMAGFGFSVGWCDLPLCLAVCVGFNN
jgi:hypothetical protein